MLRKWMSGLLVAMIMVFGLSGCVSATSYENVDVAKAYELTKDQSVEIIDVRTKEEYDGGHVPNSKLLPLQEIDAWHASLDKNKTYLIVCRSGNRSGQASKYLVDKGFTKVINMTGGMNQWQYEIEK